MRIGGIDPKTLPNEEVLVLPKGDQRLVFRARGLADMDEFERLCPEPTSPKKLTKDGWVPDTADANYTNMKASYQSRRLAYIVVRSLEPSQIEWDTVNLDDPNTWTNWEKDLKAGGLTQVECNRVLGLVWEANCLDEGKLQKARDLFLSGPDQAKQA